MAFIISGLLVLGALFGFFVEWNFFNIQQYLPFIPRGFVGPVSYLRLIALGLGILSVIVALLSLFRVRERNLALGSKKALFVLGLLVFIPTVWLAVLIVMSLLPTLQPFSR